MRPNDAEEIANSLDPDQTAPVGAVWSGTALFAQAYLSENLGSVRYTNLIRILLHFYLVSLPSEMTGSAGLGPGNCSCHCQKRNGVYVQY